MIKRIVILVVALVALIGIGTGCSVNPSGLSDSYAQQFVNKLKYVKDTRTGLCYAVVAARTTAETDSSGIGITEVPCEACEHLLVKQF